MKIAKYYVAYVDGRGIEIGIHNYNPDEKYNTDGNPLKRILAIELENGDIHYRKRNNPATFRATFNKEKQVFVNEFGVAVYKSNKDDEDHQVPDFKIDDE